MIVALQLAVTALLSLGSGAEAHVSRSDLIEKFATFCLQTGYAGALGKEVAVANGRSVPIRSAPGWPETAAWEVGDVRIFSLAALPKGRADGRPICGVAANVGLLESDDALLSEIAAKIGGGFIDGNPGRRHSDWIVPSQKWFVRVSIDRPIESDVTVYLIAEPMKR